MNRIPKIRWRFKKKKTRIKEDAQNYGTIILVMFLY